MAAALVFPQAGSFAPPSPAAAETLETQGFISYAELQKKLRQLKQTSGGKISVDVAGYTNQGREIYTARVGTGESASCSK